MCGLNMWLYTQQGMTIEVTLIVCKLLTHRLFFVVTLFH